MNILLSNLVIVYVSSFFSRLNLKKKTLETNYRNYNKIFILIAILSLIIVSGFRYKSGTDFNTYTGTFENIVNNKTINLKEQRDIGFIILCKCLSFINEDPQIMFLGVAIITNLLIVFTLIKYSKRFELSMWLYITTFAYYSTFNVLRQWISAAIIFASLKYLINERNFKRYLIIVLFAALFHMSALIMIPVYFVINSKTFSIKNVFIILSFIVFIYEKFTHTLGSILEGTQYLNYIEVIESGTNGMHPLRFLVYIVPLLIFSLYYSYLNCNNDIKIDRLINLCIVGVLICFISLKSVAFARLVIYFDLYYLLLIPIIIDIGDKKIRNLFYYIIIVAYFLFSFILLISGDGGILPYTFKITLF